MLAWLALLVLVVVEIVAIFLWLKREYYPVIFSVWAVLLYTTTFAVDVFVVWLFTMLFEPGGSAGVLTLLVVSIIAVALVGAATLFLRWVIGQELPDIQE
jgi:hypothetical protein